MKNLIPKILSLLVAICLALPVMAQAQTTVFSDNFSSSTLNPTATSPGTITGTQTAYEIGSAKNASGSSIVGNSLNLTLASVTSSGFLEAQARFATTPVTLSAPGQYIQIYYTFKDSANLLNGTAGNGSGPYIGLFNSFGAGPTNGTALANAGLTQGIFTATNGAAAGWAGYVASFNFSSNSAQAASIASRPPQLQLTNSCQELLFGSTFLNHTNIATLAGVVGQPALTTGNVYTMALQITYSNSACVGVSSTLYNGIGTGGAVVSSGGYTATMTGAATNATAGTGSGPVFTYDGLAVGYRAGATTAFNLSISNIVVITYIPALPTISNLTNETVIAGTSPTLAPTITGVPTPTYQWQTNGVNIGGATSATLPLSNVQYSQNGYVYSLIASNLVGLVTNSMTLTVIVAPSITGLGNQSASIGDTVSISPTVSGVPTPTYQWQVGGVNLTDGADVNGSTISGSQTSSLSIANAQAADSGTYSLIASNSAGIVTNSMVLTVSGGNVLPFITGPVNQTVGQGSNATFTASVSGLPTPTIQWLDQTGTPITGANNSTLTLTNVSYSQNGYVYSIVASNVVGSVTNSATLTVIVPPVITSQPASVVATNTQSVSFTVAATGVPAPKYQWYRNGSAVSSVANSTATNATFTISAVAPSDNNSTYYVLISNAAGSTNSATVSLTVNSAMSATTFTPANAATGLCYDTPLTVTFNSTIALGTNGSIKIFNVTNSTTPVDTINAASGVNQQRTFPGDGQSFTYKTIVISGSSATIYPHPNVMSSNATYYVTIDTGAFTDTVGANFAGITATNVWSFSTKVGGPANATNVVVKQDGTADFLTVEGAVGSVPGGNTTPTTINVQNGLYNEILDISGRHNITFLGQSRSGVIIYYPNNATFQAANSGTTHARMAVKVNANDIVFSTLTLSNSTPQGGSQAEALMVESGAKRCIVYNCEIDSRQDTILANVNSSQAYFYQSTIKGNFDYIWGGGNLYFDTCTIDTIAGTSGANLTAARTDTSATTSTNFPWANPGGTYTANGMSFVNCNFTADTGAGAVLLADGNGTAGNNVSWYNCTFATNYIAPSASLFSGNFVFWQDLNTSNGVAVNYPNVVSISGTDARLLAATNIPTWFYGWVPKFTLATVPPVFTAPPNGTNITINVGVNLAVSCTATDASTPAPTLTYSLLTGPSGAAVNSSSGNFTWRPTAAAANSVNPVQVVVTDGGSPALYATNSFTVTVNPLSAPVTTSAPSYSGGQFSISFSGQVGPDYELQGTTNLNSGWTSIATTNSPATMPVLLADPNAGSSPQMFYRIVAGPPLP
jgi:hypothetical protein